MAKSEGVCLQNLDFADYDMHFVVVVIIRIYEEAT